MHAALVLAALLALAGSGRAATFTIVNNDAAGEGFNDPTPASPVGGNAGTTLGQQRLNAFTYAASIWGAQLTSAVAIRVDATMDALSCSASSATLGSAGTNTAHANFPNATYANTWYPQALANRLAGSDLASGNNDIVALFNSSIGTTCPFPLTWYYGLDGNPGGSQIDFVAVALHELGHGLGFQTFVTLSTGARFNDRDDVFMKFLEDHDLGLGWPSMTNAQRAASATNDADLHWTGTAVVSAAATILTSGGRHAGSGHVQMYAPTMLQSGSSVSHFDTDCAPNELMEPFYTGALDDPSLASHLMSDLGWGSAATSTSTTSTTSSSSSTSTSTSSTSSTSSTTTSSTAASSSTTTASSSSTTSSSTSSTSTTSTTVLTSTSSSITTSTTSTSSLLTTSSTAPTTTSTAVVPSTTSSTTSTTTTSSTSSTTLTDQGAALCPPAPATTCRVSASQRSMIRLRRDPTGTRNALKWKIARGGTASPADLGDPVSGDPSLAVCLYDASGSPQPLLAATLLPGGTCDAKPCWKRLPGAGGYRYRNRAATPNGLTHLKLRLSRGGDVQLLAKGKGGNLSMPPLDLVVPLRVQLLIGDAGGTTCWESSFDGALRSDTTSFRANGS